jgi:site-specific recombinase XerD
LIFYTETGRYNPVLTAVATKSRQVKNGTNHPRVVLDFLNWLQNSRQNGNTSRNQRLAALHAFFKYMQYEDVQRLGQWQEILSVKIKKAERRSVNYLTVDGIKLLLEQIPTNTRMGRRDLALISLLYTTAAPEFRN